MGMKPVHKYLKEAIRNLKIESHDESFQSYVEMRAWNTYAAIAVKAIQEISDNSSNSSQKVVEFQNKLNSMLYGE